MRRTDEFELELRAHRTDGDNSAKYDFYAKYPLWIDVLLALQTIMPRLSHSYGIVIPRDIVLFIAWLYFSIVRPIFTCGSDSAIMMNVSGRDLVTWGHRRGGRICIDMSQDAPFMCGQVGPSLVDVSIDGVACGICFAVAWNTRGFYGWGCNEYGQLGLGDQNDEKNPVFVPMANVVTISAGDHHCAMIIVVGGPGGRGDSAGDFADNAKNILMGWGNNETGCVLVDGECAILSPCVIPISDPIAVSCGSYRTAILTIDGVWICGSNEFGRQVAKLCLRGSFTRIFMCCWIVIAESSAGYEHYSSDDVDQNSSMYREWPGYGCTSDSEDIINYHRKYGYYVPCSAMYAFAGCRLGAHPGKLLAISGGDGYMIVTTTRGAYAYSYTTDLPTRGAEHTVYIRQICAF